MARQKRSVVSSHAINVATLDLSPRELADVLVQFQDGRNDKFECAPEIASYL